MPIYEFRCLACNDLFELLMMGSADADGIKCPKCGKIDFERVMSVASHALGAGSSGASGAPEGGGCSRTRTCSDGSCTTYTVPGPD